jgi:tRNA G10  N-methylase Trm11
MHMNSPLKQMEQTSNQSLAILGRQPALGLAELESLYGSDAVQPAGPIAAVVSLDPQAIDFPRLGGTIKLGRILARLDTTDWNKIEKQLRPIVTAELDSIPEGKLKVGISIHGLDISVAKLNAAGLTLKKIIRSADKSRSVRIVPNKEPELNSAQVLHNGLATSTGMELLLVRDGTATLVARTTAVQDIDAYAARDQGRPKRDARVGMLPPKLAQTIVNLATGDTKPSADTIVLDPFCGTGVILQEALLMGYGVYGTDLEPRMIEFTAKNLEWLQDNLGRLPPAKLEVGDATKHRWDPTPSIVACEGYLGQPFTAFPGGEKLAEIRNTCNTILRKFLQNISRQIPAGTRLCLAVPAWQQSAGKFVHLPTLDHLEELGYNRISFEHVENKDLVYARADQIVARELLVLTKQSNEPTNQY